MVSEEKTSLGQPRAQLLIRLSLVTAVCPTKGKALTVPTLTTQMTLPQTAFPREQKEERGGRWYSSKTPGGLESWAAVSGREGEGQRLVGRVVATLASLKTIRKDGLHRVPLGDQERRHKTTHS